MLVLAVGNIGFAMLTAGYARSAADNPAMRVWAWSRLVQGLSHLIGWLRPDLSHPAISVAANSLLILGAAVELSAYYILFGSARWKHLLYPCTALAVLAFGSASFGHAAPATLVALMSCFIALFAGAMALVLLRRTPGDSLLQRLIGVNNLLFSVVMCVRAGNALIHGNMSAFSPGAVQYVSYLAAYLLLIVNGYGFLLLSKQKDDQQMALLATIDSLTGLVNRRAFFERTESARLLATRLRTPIALMMIDIDHFKRLNDRFGHATGDEALRLFADTAREALRDHDIMGRLGGEEFALVLPGTDLDGALQAAERLRSAVAAAVLPSSGHQYAMTVSIGVVVIDPNEHINSALARADHALYAAKSGGRDRVVAGEPHPRVR